MLQAVQALIKAATSGSTADIELALAGPSVARHINCQDEEGWTPLHHSVDGNHLAAVQLLLAHGADVNAVNGSSDSALLLAVRWSFVEVAAHMLSQPGIDVKLAVRSAF